MQRIVVAPDKFRGSLTAAEVAGAVADGIRDIAPDADVVCLPVADGGEGTVDAAVAAGFERVPVAVPGPLGESVDTSYARRDGTAVVELAGAGGLARLAADRRDPLGASSFGAGEMIAVALDDGVTRVVLGIGGSASTDGGAGLLQALGARILDDTGRQVRPGGAALREAATLDLGALHPRLRAVELVVASDVANPLLGVDGAAAVYAPQKGATPAEVAVLAAALRHWAALVATTTGTDLADVPGAGAAGGVGFAALLLGGELRPGIDVVLDLIGFRDALGHAGLVITGEGSLDRQTLSGKAPLGVARAAHAAGVPVVAVAGRCSLSADELAAAGIRAAYPLAAVEPDEGRSIANAGPLLQHVGATIAREWVAIGR